MDKATKILQTFDIKPSYMRLLVMKYMLEHRTHPTVEMIYQDLSADNPTLSRTTIYSTLKLLAEQGAIRTVFIDEKTMHYDADTSRHCHFRCRICNRIWDLPTIDLPEMPGNEDGRFVVEQVQMNYFGICQECRQKEITNI